MKKRIALLMQLIGLLWTKSLLLEAYKYIGVDASPDDLAPDELGCAESVCNIIKKIRPRAPIILGTWTLNEYFKKSKKYRQVSLPMPGDIVMSATGTGNGTIVGHVGILGRNNVVMSNDSYTGKWSTHYTLDTWRERYEKKGGIPTVYYTLI